ncbi:MAG: hypothetical protein J0M20_05480 [Burkholderiales bacterium]|nr:hypothetical protein [Burkholderiales bacterium]
MGSPVKTYQTEMYENFGFFATWLPGDPIEVGDVGVFEEGRFRREARLSDFQIPCQVEVADNASDVQFTSRNGVQLSTSAGASAGAVGELRMSIQFTGDGAFLFHASGLKVHRLGNRPEVTAAVLGLYERKRWKKEWLIVEAVHTAARTTVLISEDKAAKVELAAKSELPVPVPVASLATPDAKVQVTASEGKVFQSIGASNQHPLYACLRVKDPFFGPVDLAPFRGPDDTGRFLERPSISELLGP